MIVLVHPEWHQITGAHKDETEFQTKNLSYKENSIFPVMVFISLTLLPANITSIAA